MNSAVAVDVLFLHTSVTETQGLGLAGRDILVDPLWVLCLLAEPPPPEGGSGETQCNSGVQGQTEVVHREQELTLKKKAILQSIYEGDM